MTETGTIVVNDFGVQPDTRADATPAVRSALASVHESRGRRLTFAPGRYDFWPDRAAEHLLFVSNNDSGLKRVVFPLLGFDDFEVDGQGPSSSSTA